MSAPGADLAAVYQRVILEHHEHPRNAGPLADATHEARVDNPLCGDRVTLRLRVEDDRLAALRFEGDGCAISQASASLLAGGLEGATVEAARALEAELRRLLSRDEAEHATADRARLGDLCALEGTRRFPPRIQCALLAWNALSRALAGA